MFCIRCRGLVKRYGKTTPAQDISFEFAAGQITSIVGESGCGKTTLLRMIAGLELPDSGSVEYVDQQSRDGSKTPVISMVFQEPRLFDWLTVRENIALAVRSRPRDEQLELIDETLRTVGLSAAADKYPQELSGGMAQRVGMARALCRRPDILLLDEAFSSLDALTREKLRAQFISIAAQRPMTTILVTHDVAEAVMLSRTVCKLKNGAIEQVWNVAAPYPRSIGTPGLAALVDEILQSFFVHNEAAPVDAVL